MPLIWNDDEMHYLSDSEEFDKNQFAIARKLFIQFKDVEKGDINENWIKEKFHTFGVIEQIEFFRNENGAWSYLTFSNDSETYLALNGASSIFTEIAKIIPADTWCQPEPPIAKRSSDDSVIESINRFADVSKSGKCRNDVSSLLVPMLVLSLDSNSESVKDSMENRILPTVKTFTLDLENRRLSLSDVRGILRNIGPYLCDLTVKFQSDKWPRNLGRYFFKMCQYVGPALKILRLKYVPRNEDWLQHLKPLLSGIECLEVQICNYDFDMDFDFQSHCPNLKTLKIRMNMKGELLTKSWPSLEKISIRDNQYMEEKLVLEFMKNNPQLIYLKIAANDCNNLLKQIPLHLSNLEKLCLYQAYPNICAENLAPVIDLKHLKRLKLMYLDDEDFNGILSCLPKFKELRQLKLHIFYDGVDSVDLDELHQPTYESIVCLAQELHQLECFHIRFCQFDELMLFSFIRYATKLMSIGVYKCGLQITDAILENIDGIRKSANPTTLVLYADKISSELNEEKTYHYVTLVKL